MSADLSKWKLWQISVPSVGVNHDVFLASVWAGADGVADGRHLAAVACARWGYVGGKKACVAYGRRHMTGIQPEVVAAQVENKMPHVSDTTGIHATQSMHTCFTRQEW